MYCDNLALIQRIGWHIKKDSNHTKRCPPYANYDLEAAIKDTIDTLQTNKILIKEKHVRGHQDRQADHQNLNHEEQLNVEVDHEATAAL